MESGRFDVLALPKALVNGLLSEWLTVREKMKVETVRDNTSRLLQINKLFSSLGLLVSSAVVGCRGAERSGGSCLGRAHTSPWRVFSLTLMGAFTRIFRLASQRSAARPGDKGPFMAQSGSIHGCEVFCR